MSALPFLYSKFKMSVLNHVFLAHGLLESVLAVGCIVSPQRAVSAIFVTPEKLEPFVEAVARLFGSSLLATCAIAFLCAPLPNVLPCKRNAGLGLMLYHIFGVVQFWHYRNSTGLVQPNVAYGVAGIHAVMALAFYLHWNVSGRQVKEFNQAEKKSK